VSTVFHALKSPTFLEENLIFYRRKPRPETECKECGYDLRASMEFGRCPECGTPIKTKESSIQSDM
ncbi:MAG TPA: hypothetical protein PKN33_16390, partial [Phycisphaerae bacterium]|nr:hypothetical protein [Phycisphaerae bacterium]